MKKIYIILGSLILLWVGGIYIYSSQFRDKIEVRLSQNNIDIYLVLKKIKLPLNEDVEIHTRVLDTDKNEVLFVRNRLTNKTQKNFRWTEKELELAEGKYQIESNLLVLPPLLPPKVLLESKEKILLR